MQTKPLGRLRHLLRWSLGVFLVVLCFGTPAQASTPHLYWIDNLQHTIGTSDTNGSNPNSDLIDFGYLEPRELESDATYVYWVDHALNSIGRARRDGSDLQRRFIPNADASSLAVDSGHLYWLHRKNGSYSDYSISRSNLDGSNRTDTYFDGITDVSVGDLTAKDGYLYWSEYDSATGSNGTIDIYKLQATDQPTQLGSIITLPTPANDTGAAPPALTVAGDKIYWTDTFTSPKGQIGRANLDGTAVQKGFITNIDGLDNILTTANTKLYWAADINETSGTYESRIGQADLDGTNFNQTLWSQKHVSWDIEGHGWPIGLTVTNDRILLSVMDEYGQSTSTVWQFDLSGQKQNQDLVQKTVDVPSLNIASDDQHLYWGSNPLVGNAIGGWQLAAIARADLDGSNVDKTFVGVPAALNNPSWWSVDAITLDKKYLYWAWTIQSDDGTTTHGIARTNLITRETSVHFADLPTGTLAIAVTASKLYWAHSDGNPPTAAGDSRIGQMNIDGTNNNPDFMTGLSSCDGYWNGVSWEASKLSSLVASDEYLYWADTQCNRIGRADLDGANRNPSFVTTTLADGSNKNEVAPASLTLYGTSLLLLGNYYVDGGASRAPLQVPTAGGQVTTLNVGSFDLLGVTVAPNTVTTPGDGPTNPPQPTKTVTTPPTSTPPSTTPNPLPNPTTSTPASSPTPAQPSKPSTPTAQPIAAVGASKVKRRKQLTIATKNVANGTKLTVTWKPRKGKATKQQLTVKTGQVQATAPRKKGRYVVTISLKGITIGRSTVKVK